MAKSGRSKWRALVGSIKAMLRKPGMLNIAFWVVRFLYYVAKFFD